MLPDPRTSRSSVPRPLRRQSVFQHPLFWGAGAVLLLSGWFLLEYLQPRFASSRQEASSAPNTVRHTNPLRSSGASSNSATYSGGSLPGLPQPVLPGEPNARSPIDPTLSPARSSPDQVQPQTNSRSILSRSRTGSNSQDLYNPTRILMPRAWGTRAASQTPEAPSVQPFSSNDTAANSPASPSAVSPLQSALDRMGTSPSAPNGTPSMLPQPSEAVPSQSFSGIAGENSTGGGAIGAGATGTGQTNSTSAIPQMSYPQTAPPATGYSLPPAFRTTGNTPPFSGSSSASPVQPEATPSSMSPVPSTVPQSNSGQPIGNGGINTFSNP